MSSFFSVSLHLFPSISNDLKHYISTKTYNLFELFELLANVIITGLAKRKR